MSEVASVVRHPYASAQMQFTVKRVHSTADYDYFVPAW